MRQLAPDITATNAAKKIINVLPENKRLFYKQIRTTRSANREVLHRFRNSEDGVFSVIFITSPIYRS